MEGSLEAHLFVIIIFSLAGYFCGSLLRNVGLLKLILIFVVIPFFLDLLTSLNIIWQVTVPFLISSYVGYLSLPKAQK